MHILGTGTDIVECLRIAQMIERHGELFISRVYTDHEIEYCTARKAATQHYAGRWAAKEAVLKALGTGWRRGISWRDIEIRNDRNGAPTVALERRRPRCDGTGRHPPAPRHDLPLSLPRRGVRHRRRRGLIMYDFSCEHCEGTVREREWSGKRFGTKAVS